MHLARASRPAGGVLNCVGNTDLARQAATLLDVASLVGDGEAMPSELKRLYDIGAVRIEADGDVYADPLMYAH